MKKRGNYLALLGDQITNVCDILIRWLFQQWHACSAKQTGWQGSERNDMYRWWRPSWQLTLRSIYIDDQGHWWSGTNGVHVCQFSCYWWISWVIDEDTLFLSASARCACCPDRVHFVALHPCYKPSVYPWGQPLLLSYILKDEPHPNQRQPAMWDQDGVSMHPSTTNREIGFKQS